MAGSKKEVADCFLNQLVSLPGVPGSRMYSQPRRTVFPAGLCGVLLVEIMLIPQSMISTEHSAQYYSQKQLGLVHGGFQTIFCVFKIYIQCKLILLIPTSVVRFEKDLR